MTIGVAKISQSGGSIGGLGAESPAAGPSEAGGLEAKSPAAEGKGVWRRNPKLGRFFAIFH